ncbi:glycoside hydrolase domain-containing protein [Nocardioides sp.]|uniref:glycoside hydrolase domain-containing protein n=1 Tax=Nocardioides sp. TaxID=35761 RepID=UPI002735F71B|nr:glycoside hydrolase domain-containing protein [Nocardioides sp.]MDP3892195.1 DUF1906 domain-containing protein [Nocardioides sp.]
MNRSLPRTLTAVGAALATTVAGVVATVALAAPATASNPTTPGDITGYGFDQCVAPTQRAMNKWLSHSPFLAVGIYTSGASRGCRSQPNLTPTWVRKQLRKGWRLLPITLGPQAFCHPSFPRYGNDPVINGNPGKKGKYGKARKQGRAEAVTAVNAAKALGIVPTSTLWYDLEGFDITNTHCRESSLYFLHAWTKQIRSLGYVSGVYSSAGSGIKMLDDARRQRPGTFVLPDRIWIARWDGIANTSTSYIAEDGWRPGGRMKQYRGGHKETWGGVTINIDSNFLDLGRGSVPARSATGCGTRIDFRSYKVLTPSRPRPRQLKALQCLLKSQGLYGGKVNGKYTARTQAAVQQFQTGRPGKVSTTWTRRNWMQVHAVGPRPVVKFGSVGPAVRRLQRALNAAGAARLDVTGHFDKATDTALRAYQRKVGVSANGVAAGPRWKVIAQGRR